MTVTFSGTDALSGIAGCTLPVVLSNEGAGQAASGTCSDQAGNSSAPATASNIKIDKTAPVVSVTGVSQSGVYTLPNVPVAGCTTQDALSGVATQATVSVTGGNANGVGTFTATCSGALDVAGNPGAVSVTYAVRYPFVGFFQPVDNLPMVNTVNAGQSIPVKFSLRGNRGLNIFASGYPAVQACGGGGGSGPIDEIEETVSSGSGLSYNAASDSYSYVWKTDKAWAGACRQLIVRLNDGTDHVALFQFKGKPRSVDEDTVEEGEESTGDENAPYDKQIFLPIVANNVEEAGQSKTGTRTIPERLNSPGLFGHRPHLPVTLSSLHLSHRLERRFLL